MSITIGSNITSLGAQRRLGESSAIRSSTFERLSSGQRINRASDDAAGLSIVSSLNTDRAVFLRGVRNLNDGVSALTIAEGAIEALTTIVTRLEELAEQSANGVLGDSQRRSLNEEAQALSDEYFRISKSTKFNGLQLLDGSMDEIRLQSGYGTDGGIGAGIGGAIGTGNFGENASYATGVSPYGINLGDLNGDGALDMVTADSTDNVASVYIGRGDGSFYDRSSFSVGLTPRGVNLGDLNRDGVLDLVTADRFGSSVSVLLGNGDGTFAARASISTGSWPFAVALGDLNGDGALDMATADYGGHSASVLIGKGDGTFYDRISFAAGSRPYAIAFGDTNADGILDMATADYQGRVLSVFVGNGNGTFLARNSLPLGSSRPMSVKMDDLNGDGFDDLVSGDLLSGNSVSIFMANGDGTFAARTTLRVGSSGPVATLGDLNGDGVLDIATQDNAVNVYIGNGNGTFLARSSFSTVTFTRNITLGDLNSDGVLDIATLDGNQANVYLAQTKDGVAPLLPFDLTTLAGARQALPVFQQKLHQLALQRGEIGAFQSRLQVAASVLHVSAENFAAAEGRIMSADVAAESATLMRTQILQQTGSAILGQANQQPTLALMLLTS